MAQAKLTRMASEMAPCQGNRAQKLMVARMRRCRGTAVPVSVPPAHHYLVLNSPITKCPNCQFLDVFACFSARSPITGNLNFCP